MKDTNEQLGRGQSCEMPVVMNEIRVSCIFILLTNAEHKWLMSCWWLIIRVMQEFLRLLVDVI